MKIAICEDEEFFSGRLNELISEYMGKNKLDCSIRIFENGELFVEQYKNEERFDIIFLDIQLGDMDGYETAIKIREFDKKVPIIFVTNFINFAPLGYKIGVFRYVLKMNIDFEIVESLAAAILHLSDKEDSYVFKTEKVLVRMKLEDIYYFESDRKNITVHTTKGAYTYKGKISDVEKKLGNKGFVKPYKGFLANTKQIFSIEEGNIYFSDGEKIPVSRNYYKPTLEAIALTMEG